MTMNNSSAKTGTIAVAVVDDDDEIRANFMDQIARTPGLRLAASFANAEIAIAELPAINPDVVLMDINLPGIDGVECVRALKAKMPAAQFIMLTVYQDSNRLINSLMAGASGYLLKRTSPAKLVQAIREVRSGGAPMTPEMARRLVQHFQHAPARGAALPSLSPRETDVLNQLSKGYTYKEIADHLQIGVGTLQRYIACIYEKMHVHSRTEAVVKYLNVSP
jgi:DNA-binding NarL/FixJ family response regulator